MLIIMLMGGKCPRVGFIRMGGWEISRLRLSNHYMIVMKHIVPFTSSKCLCICTHMMRIVSPLSWKDLLDMPYHLSCSGYPTCPNQNYCSIFHVIFEYILYLNRNTESYIYHLNLHWCTGNQREKSTGQDGVREVSECVMQGLGLVRLGNLTNELCRAQVRLEQLTTVLCEKPKPKLGLGLASMSIIYLFHHYF